MIEIKLRVDEIVIQPSEVLDVYNVIYSRVKSLVGTCNKEYGYIRRVVSIKEYKQIHISRTSGCIVYIVTFEIECIKPCINKIYKSKVINVLKEGIFFTHEELTILVRAELMDDYSYSCGTFVRNDNLGVLVLGTIIDVEINGFQYDNNTYRCVGLIRG